MVASNKHVWRGLRQKKNLVIPDHVLRIECLYSDDEPTVARSSHPIETAVLPRDLYFIEQGVFSGHAQVREISIDECNERYETRDGVLFDKRDGVLLAYPPAKEGEVYEIPEGTRVVGRGAFWGCRHLRRVICPDSLERVESSAFRGNPNLHVVFKRSFSYGGFVADWAFAQCGIVEMPGEHVVITQNCFAIDQDVRLFKCSTIIMAPGIPVNAPLTNLKDSIAMGHMMLAARGDVMLDEVEEAARKYIGHFSKRFRDKVTEYPWIADYLLGEGLLSESQMRSLCTVARKAGDNDLLDRLKESLAHPGCASEWRPAGGVDHRAEIPEAEPFVAERLAQMEIPEKVQEIAAGALLAHDKGHSSAEMLKLFIMLASHRHEELGRLRSYGRAQTLHWTEKELDELGQYASMFDRHNLCLVLRALVERRIYPALPALAFVGDDDDVAFVDECIERWIDFVAFENVRDLALASSALLTRDSVKAARVIDKYRALPEYATLRGMSEEEYRDRYLSNCGFDEEGRLERQIRGKTILFCVDSDFKLTLFDEETDEELVLPRDWDSIDDFVGFEYELHQEVYRIENEIKEITLRRRELLIYKYLEGRAIEAGHWKKFYLTNPLLRSYGERLVWSQSDATFVVCDGSLVRADGSQYVMTNEGVKVAHPCEMTPESIEAWKAYFIERAIVQPFEQVWERFVDVNRITADRYDGRSFLLRTFRKMEDYGFECKDSYDYYTSRAMVACSNPHISFTSVCQDDSRYYYDEDEEFLVDGLSEYEFVNPKEARAAKRKRRVHTTISFLDYAYLHGLVKHGDMLVLAELEGLSPTRIVELMETAHRYRIRELEVFLPDYLETHFPWFKKRR